MLRLSLRLRLSLILAGVLALLLALDAALTLFGAGRRVDPEIAGATALTRDVLSEAVASVKPGPDLPDRLAALATSLDRLRHVRVAYAPPGADFPAAKPHAGPPGWFVALVRPRAAVSTLPAIVAGQPAGAFRVSGDPSDELEELWDSLVTLALDGALAAALGFGLVYLALGRALAPLDRLNAGLAALGRRDYDARLVGEAAPEFAPLLQRFNALGDSLTQAERENRALRARLVSIQDDERKEIARELHDEIGPHLFAARAQAGAARRTTPGLDGLIETLDALQSVNRRILDRLRPIALEELGLGPALFALGRFYERNAAALRIEVEIAPLPALGLRLETALYRIAQEALINVARHSGATHARVTLRAEAGVVVLRIADDGRGLSPGAAAGRGQIGMLERAAAYGGALALRPQTPQGFVVEASFPQAKG
jgi:two-component system sensor histidine kinase UhpB